jgi:hypothetical protein
MANTTLLNDYAQVGKRNLQFERNWQRWQFLLESYAGGDEYRNGQHLTRYALETQGEYTARLRNTPLDNHCRSVISVYVSFLFRQPPTRDLQSIDGDLVQDFLRDADLDGRSLDAFIKQAAIWAGVFGHTYILMTKPSVQAQTLADQRAAGVRPYLNLLTPLMVTDWQWSRAANGRYDLTYFKYIEEVVEGVTTIREWTPDIIRTWVLDDVARTARMTVEETNELGRIPVVVLYGQRGQVRGMGLSDISDIADQQRAIYNELSEVEQSIRLEGHPSLVVTPDTQVGSGAGAMIHMPEGLEPGLKPYMLNIDAAPIDTIWSSIRNRVESIDRMSNTGSVRATESRTMSGVAMETEFQLLNALLSEKADNLELAEEQLWQWWCEYEAQQWMGSIHYPRAFGIRDINREFEYLNSARTAATDPQVLGLIDQRLTQTLAADTLT